MTFKNYLESKGQSRQSIASGSRHVMHFINWTEDQGIESESTCYAEIIAYIKHLQTQGVKQRTVQIYLSSLKHYFLWLKAQEVRMDNPLENVQIKGVKRHMLYHILKKKELEGLYGTFKIPQESDPHANQNWYKASVLTAKRNKVILGLMIWQGMEASSLSVLQVKDVKLREGKITIAGTRRSNARELKLEAHQMLDLMEYTLQIRKALLEQRKKQTTGLFVGTGQSDRFNNILAQVMQKLKKMNPAVTSAKQIRASVIVYWLKQYNLREVQYMSGHRYISSTENYLINDLDDLTEEITKFHPIG